jgi:hypothetical protein
MTISTCSPSPYLMALDGPGRWSVVGTGDPCEGPSTDDMAAGKPVPSVIGRSPVLESRSDAVRAVRAIVPAIERRDGDLAW